MCASAGLGENGVSRVKRWLQPPDVQSLLAVAIPTGQRFFVQSRRASKRVRSEFNCQCKGRQLRYLDGNACTEYEDESDV